MSKGKIITVFIVAIVLMPLWMSLAWLLTPKKKLVAVIIDKTVENTKAVQHLSFTWMLNNERFTKTKTANYKSGHDYFGFFPLGNEEFRLKGLERFSSSMLEKLSNDADLVYITDTYGVYKNEWYKKNEGKGAGMIYGGMSEQDMELLRLMKAKHKLIISEFNTIGAPTSEKIRSDFEQLFAVKWSGWIGRYFASLDPLNNSDLPAWIIQNYKNAHQSEWPFRNAGIVFTNRSSQVVVLEEGVQLATALPEIHANKTAQNDYGLPEKTNYPFWFDVMKFDTSSNKFLAEFVINANTAGKEILTKNNIPTRFPAIITHKNKDYRFYYFSGNFCDNPISENTSFFKGVSAFKSFFYNADDITDRRQFFWKFYLPLVSKITNDYYESGEINARNISNK